MEFACHSQPDVQVSANAVCCHPVDIISMVLRHHVFKASLQSSNVSDHMGANRSAPTKEPLMMLCTSRCFLRRGLMGGPVMCCVRVVRTGIAT